MTTRLQVLRSSTTNILPAAGTRLPGELWVNLADFQLGMIDASRNAQKLVAVRFFVTTATYAAGDVVVQAGKLYVANGAVAPGSFTPAQWSQIAAASDITAALAAYLPLTGGALTGALALAADPTSAAQAATKNYVDGKFAVAGQGIFLPLAGGTLSGALTLAADPVGNLQPATKQYALNRAGDTMLGLLTLSGPPTLPLHAATKAYVDSGVFLPLGGGTLTGPLTLAANPAAALQAAPKQYVDGKSTGVTDGSAASQGQIGEYASAQNLTPVGMATATPINIASLPLSAGDWDVDGDIYMVSSAGANTMNANISTTSATQTPIGTPGRAQIYATAAYLSNVSMPIGKVRLSLSAAATVFLVAYAVFASGTCTGQGTIQARRVR